MFGVKIVLNNMLRSHYSPITLRHFAENTGSWLTGFESWLSIKVGFKVEVFTIIQKECLICPSKEQGYRIGDKVYVGPVTYSLMMKQISQGKEYSRTSCMPGVY